MGRVVVAELFQKLSADDDQAMGLRQSLVAVQSVQRGQTGRR
ncbi:MAG TPA: hypothetical protein VIU11_26065 [Nakamurella sp.]